MKIVVKKNALENVINSLVNEERSYHSRNVNELEKADPPILPQPQMAQQLSMSEVPVDDSEFMPTNKSELGKAAMELAQKVDSRSIKNYYKGMKELTKSYQDSPPKRTSNTHSLDEAQKVIDNFVKKILVAEARGSLSHLDPETRDLVKTTMQSSAQQSDAAVKATRDEIKAQDLSLPLSDFAIGDASRLLDAIIKAKNITPSPTAASELETEFQNALQSMRFTATPDVIKIQYPGLPSSAGTSYNLGTDPRNRFDEETYKSVLNALGSQNSAGTQHQDSVGPIYAARLTPAPEVEVEPEAIDDIGRKPRETGKSHLETTTYAIALSDVIDMLDEKPDEFMVLLKKVGPVEFEGTSYDPATMTIDQFDDLDDLVKMEFIKKIARLPKEVFEPTKRELQVMARGLGPIFDDEDEGAALDGDFVVSPEGAIMGSPRVAFAGDLLQIVYDETITTPIRRALGFTNFDISADQFIGSLGSDDEIEKFRDFAKDIIKKALVNNTAEFRDILDVFYHILKTEKLEILDKAKAKSAITEVRKEDELYSRKSLAPYRTAVEILNKIGMPLDKSMLDQNFRDMISFNHLSRAIIYAIIIKYVMSLDLDKDERDRNAMAGKIRKAIEDQFDSPTEFILPASGRSPPGFGNMLGYRSPGDLPPTWADFSRENKEKIDKLVNRIVKAQKFPTADEIALNARNLAGPIEELVDDFKTGIELSIGTMLGKEGGKLFKSIDPKNLAYIIKALEMFKGTVDEADQSEVDETLEQLRKVKPGGTVDKLTAAKKMSDFPEGEPLFQEHALRNLIRKLM